MISIIIPTFNEKDNIVRLIILIKKVLRKEKYSYEIIVVDDNSPDRTGEIIKTKYKKDKKIRIFIRKKQKGLATAILFGIRKAGGSIIVGMDADFNHPPRLIPSLVKKLTFVDLVVASRFVKGGGMEEKWRYYPTYLFNLFLKYILGFPTMDNMSGFYAIKKKKLFTLPLDYIYHGYGEYHLRLVYLIKKDGYKVEEIPAFFKKREFGKSKTNLLTAFFKYLFISISLIFYKQSEKK